MNKGEEQSAVVKETNFPNNPTEVDKSQYLRACLKVMETDPAYYMHLIVVDIDEAIASIERQVEFYL